MNNTDMTCIACGESAARTAIRGDVEAAFCQKHCPRDEMRITICISR